MGSRWKLKKLLAFCLAFTTIEASLARHSHTKSSSLRSTKLTSLTGKNVFKESASPTNPIGKVIVKLPHDRAQPGTMNFGPLDGKYYTCSVMGLGVVRNWKGSPPARTSFVCEGHTVRTKAADWEKSASTGVYFLKDVQNTSCGVTPLGPFTVQGLSGIKSRWGSRPGVNIIPNFRTTRGSFLTHSDDRFDTNPNIADFTHHTAGCLKLEPFCQDLFIAYASANRHNDVKLEVSEK